MSLKNQIIQKYAGNSKFCSANEALDFIAEFRNGVLTKLFLSREDVKESLSELSPKQLIEMAKRIDDSYFWDSIVSRIDVQEYMCHLSVEDAIAFAKKIDREQVWRDIFSRGDVRLYLQSD